MSLLRDVIFLTYSTWFYLDRGGGGDSSWHKSGSGLYKQNSIDDFISCANYLVSENFVNRHHLSAIGLSAGSLLLGAAINMCPDLFRAVILKVYFFSKVKVYCRYFMYL